MVRSELLTKVDAFPCVYPHRSELIHACLGPSGIPLQDFWQLFFAASKLYVGGAGDHPAVRAKVWEELRKDPSGTCRVFRPPKSASANDRSSEAPPAVRSSGLNPPNDVST